MFGPNIEIDPLANLRLQLALLHHLPFPLIPDLGVFGGPGLPGALAGTIAAGDAFQTPTRAAPGVTYPKHRHYIGRVTVTGDGVTGNYRMIEAQDGSLVLVGSAIDAKSATRRVDTVTASFAAPMVGELGVNGGRMPPRLDATFTDLTAVSGDDAVTIGDVDATMFTEFDPRTGFETGAVIHLGTCDKTVTIVLNDFLEGLTLLEGFIGGVIVVGGLFLLSTSLTGAIENSPDAKVKLTAGYKDKDQTIGVDAEVCKGAAAIAGDQPPVKKRPTPVPKPVKPGGN